MNHEANGKRMFGDAPGNGVVIISDRKSWIEHRERLLDEALAQSFPASDPPSICSARGWPVDAGRLETRLDKGGTSSIFNNMSERSEIRRPQLHPGSSTARF